MQDYSNPSSRNVSIAAGRIGGNQTQGKGELPSKVSVPMPGMNGSSAKDCKPGSKAKAPAGFSGGIINGKI